MPRCTARTKSGRHDGSGGELDERDLSGAARTSTPGADRLQESAGLRALQVLARPADAAALAAILLCAGAGWAYLIGWPVMPGSAPGAGMGQMDMSGMDMPDMAMPALVSWTWREGALLFGMWAIMMVAMMLPSAAPMILLFSRVGAGRSARGGTPVPMAFFALGYVVVWWAFSAIAALTQWHLHRAALLSADMQLAGPAAAMVLIAAGIYQWLPVKERCLAACRSPIGFLSTYWRDGYRGAFSMGVTHGAFCVGCCWLLMALLFVTGVMSLVWVAAIAAVVLVEKVFPAGRVISRVAGILFIGAGAAILL